MNARQFSHSQTIGKTEEGLFFSSENLVSQMPNESYLKRVEGQKEEIFINKTCIIQLHKWTFKLFLKLLVPQVCFHLEMFAM